jgi:Protein of unknown function (DUF3631)
LLSRCIPLHLTRAPQDSIRKSTRLRALERDAQPLREMLEAYSVQAARALVDLYEREAPEGYWPGITDREAEIWGPLLLHAKSAGHELEDELLNAFKVFSREKREIQRDDWTIARTITLHAAIKDLEDKERFTPHDVLAALTETEAWASSFSKSKDDRARCAKIGFFLRTFRLQSDHARTGSSYSRAEALKALAAHIPEIELDRKDPPQTSATVPMPMPVHAPVRSAFLYRPRTSADRVARINQTGESVS